MPAENPIQSVDGSAPAVSTGIGALYTGIAGLQTRSIRKSPIGLELNHIPQTYGAKKPRAYGADVYEVMLEEDRDRAKRKLQETDEWPSQPTIILGNPRIKSIKVSSLCPPFKKRFIHPGGE